MLRPLPAVLLAGLLAIPLASGGARGQAGADAEALWAAGLRARALDVMEQQLASRPDDDALRLALAGRQLELQRATAALATANPLGPEADGLRGMAYSVLARYAEAVPLLSAADPGQALMRVEALMALGRDGEADTALAAARAVVGDGDPRLLSLTGRRAAASGRHEDAVAAFRAALAADPLDRQALFGLGQSLVRSGHRDEGLAVLQRHRELLPLLDQRDSSLQALDLDRSHADSHAAVGDIERQLGLLESSQQRYRAAEALSDPADLAPIVLRHARLLAEDLHDLPGALALLDAATGTAADARLPVRAGDLLAAAGRTAEAIDRYRRALELRPGDEHIAQRLRALEEAPK